MPKRDPRVTEYIQQRAPFARPILRHLRKAIHNGAPGLEEAIKWGMPSFLHRGKIVCGFAGFKAHCALWFWNGKTVVGQKSEKAMGNFGRITTMADLPSETEIERYVRKGVALIEQGR
jgi:hypothetical protein